VRAVVDGDLSKAAAARRCNTMPKTVGNWIERFEAEGVEGLRDRSSRPNSSPSQATPAVCVTVEVRAVSAILASRSPPRSGFRRRPSAASQEPRPRASPTRRSCPKTHILLGLLFNCLRFFRSLGVKVHRVMTDNGSSFRSFRYGKALRLLRIKHLRIKPYTPRTNGQS
jgi:leucine-zipper of insertion element IS481